MAPAPRRWCSQPLAGALRDPGPKASVAIGRKAVTVEAIEVTARVVTRAIEIAAGDMKPAATNLRTKAAGILIHVPIGRIASLANSRPATLAATK